MPDASISRNPGVLSSHTVRTLKTETREKPEAEGGFWDKFKSLSLGQKIGRSFATIGSGVAVGGAGLGIGMAAGLGLGIATGGIAAVAFGLGALGFYGMTRLVRSGKEEARVVRQEECRPRETKIQKSEATLPTRANIPLETTTVLGAEDRQAATAHILNQVCETGFEENGPASGLSKGFMPDLHRSEFTVQTSDGRLTNFGRSSFQNAGKDLSKLTDGDKSEGISLFKNAITSEPSLGGDQDKIAKWQKAASGFMNQISPMGTQALSVVASKLQLAERRGDYQSKYNLRIEPGGNSAILECIETGGIDGINSKNENGGLDGNSWQDEESALDYGIDRGSSTLKKVTVLRITLEEEGAQNVEGAAKQIRDGVGLEVLSYSSSYSLGLMSQVDYDNKFAARDANQIKENENKYQLHLMGRQPISGWEVLNLEKNLIPDSREYADAIANGTASPDEMKSMVEACYNRLARLAVDIPMRDDVEDEDRAEMAQKTIPGRGVAEKYPLSEQNCLAGNGDKRLVGDSVRDFDLQEFAETKAREEVGTRILGITPEAYFSAIKPSGPGMVLGKTFAKDERLHAISVKLRANLVQAFDEATTLDDFYSKASTLVENARLEANALDLK